MLLQETPEIKVIGNPRMASIQVKGLFNPQEMDKAWYILRTFLSENNIPCEETLYVGKCYKKPSDTKEGELYYMANVSLPEDKEDLKLFPEIELSKLEEMEYACFTHKGSFDNLAESYGYIFQEWAPKNEGVRYDAPSLEIYLNSPDAVSEEELLTLICIPFNSK
ncbi:MAG: GyrI-like domain-containing protein [Bacteroidales bacterium]